MVVVHHTLESKLQIYIYLFIFSICTGFKNMKTTRQLPEINMLAKVLITSSPTTHRHVEEKKDNQNSVEEADVAQRRWSLVT